MKKKIIVHRNTIMIMIVNSMRVFLPIEKIRLYRKRNETFVEPSASGNMRMNAY